MYTKARVAARGAGVGPVCPPILHSLCCYCCAAPKCTTASLLKDLAVQPIAKRTVA